MKNVQISIKRKMFENFLWTYKFLEECSINRRCLKNFYKYKIVGKFCITSKNLILSFAMSFPNTAKKNL